MNRLKQNPNTGAEDTCSQNRPDSTGSEEHQGNNAIVETRCDVTKNPAEKSNYFRHTALALAVLSLALNVGLFQSLMAMKTDMTANQIQMENLRRDLLNQQEVSKKDMKANQIQMENLRRDLLYQQEVSKKDMKANQIQMENLRRDLLNQQEVSKKDMKANQIQMENLRRDLLNQEEVSKKDMKEKHIQMENLKRDMLNQEGLLKKVAEHELKRTSVYSPHVENEAKLNDLRWIRDLITNWYNTELKAKLSNWQLRLQNAENMFESNGSLRSLESQEKALSELLDEKQLESFADVLFDKEYYTEVLGLYEKIFKKRIVSLGPDHYDTLNAQYSVARCLGRLGEYSKALPLYRFAYQKLNQTLGPDNSATLLAQHGVAVMLHNEGKYADALRIYEQVLPKQVSTLGENHAITTLTKSNMAIARRNL